MEYLFFGFGIIYFIFAAIGIIGTAIIEFVLKVFLSGYWLIKDLISK